jgi:hypothetical protein
MATAPTIERVTAHEATIMTSTGEIAQTVSEVLTRDLTAYMVKVSDAGTINRWISEQAKPRTKYEQKLRLAYEIIQLLRATEHADETVRAWFLGLNPHLDDDPPAEAIREGRLKETLAAARAFIAGSY